MARAHVCMRGVLDTPAPAPVTALFPARPCLCRLYESWLVQDYCDSGSLADLVSLSSSSQADPWAGPGPSPSSTSGSKDRFARLRASICCSPDPQQRMLANLLCLLDVASGLDYLHSCCNMVGGWSGGRVVG